MNSKKILQYFSGLLLMPWILVLGYYIILIVFLFYYKSMANFIEVSQVTRNRLGQNIDLTTLMIVSGLMILLNYTISFLTLKKYPTFATIIFLSTVFLLLVLLIFAWPHFKIVLLGS